MLAQQSLDPVKPEIRVTQIVHTTRDVTSDKASLHSLTRTSAVVLQVRSTPCPGGEDPRANSAASYLVDGNSPRAPRHTNPPTKCK